MKKRRRLQRLLLLGAGCLEICGVCILLGIGLVSRTTDVKGIFRVALLLIVLGAVLALLAGQFMKESER